MNRARESGAALVEMAIVLIIFLALVFAIIEFSLLIFNYSRVIESTRAGVRYAIVNNVEAGCASGVANITCPGGAAVSCSLANSSLILAEMQKTVQAGVIEAGNVDITYACATGAGQSERPTPILLVTVTVTGVEHHFTVPGVIGLGDELTLTLPAQSATRISEDLYTYTAP
ncbi:TadE-like protein [Mariprofundus ferrinatatus]|uniref:TadE-like protein n=1 Tax=Mariprofundus ferrinatatus TaxID=1921087 RepID=A0A2K8L3U0_9PROT|nr:TadE family protein [Mariprofundus ferrinatatus]ATX81772.1 TadE-like protein [Mariprofundus ferrinatatus]